MTERKSAAAGGMKKTDKIEIRVSPEEKAALARLSQASGRTISETIRNLLAAQIATAPAEPAPKSDKPAMTITQKVLYAGGGTLLGGLGVLGVAGAMAAAAPHPQAGVPAYEVHVSINEAKTSKFYGVGSTLPISQETSRIRLPVDETYAYLVDVIFRQTGQETINAEFNICRETKDACLPVANPVIVVSPDKPSNMMFVASDDRQIEIDLSPTEIQMPKG